MPSEGLKDAEFQKPLTDADFAPPLTDADFANSKPGNPSDAYSAFGLGIMPSNEEMAPDLSYADRWKVKNFGATPQQSIEYLKQKLPGYQISNDHGDIYMTKGGKKYALDPKGLDLGDLGDIAWDIPAGIATTAASGAAGLAGGAGTLGVGALPAAAGAGALTSGGLETLRQKIGQYLGVNKPKEGDFYANPSQAVLATATGGLAPILFGTGASASQIAEKAAEQGLSEDAAQALANTQRGVVSRGYNALLSKGSGITPRTLDYTSKNLDKIKALEESAAPESEMGQNILDQGQKIMNAKQSIGKGIQAAEAAAGPVDISAAKQPILDEIAQLESGTITPAIADKISALKGLLKTDLTVAKPEVPKSGYEDWLQSIGQGAEEESPKGPLVVSPIDSRNIKQSLYEKGQSAALDPTAANAASRASGIIGDIRRQQIPGVDKLNDQYAAISDMVDQLGKAGVDKNKAFNMIRTIGTKSNAVRLQDLAKMDKEYGTNFVDQADLAAAFDIFRKGRPAEMGFKSLSKMPPAEIGGGALGGLAGYGTGHGYVAGATGAIVGGGTGKALFSPESIRGQIELGRKLAPLSPWLRQSVQPTLNMEINK